MFLIHEEDFVKYRKIIDGFMRGWSGIFSEEYTGKGDPASKVSSDKMSLRKADGTVVTMWQRADSDRKECSLRTVSREVKRHRNQ